MEAVLLIMMKPGRAIGQKPVVPPRRRSLLYMRSISKTATFNFPDSHHLIITTSKGVFIWDREGILPVFQSETGGIVASRKTANDSELLAVADSQVVLLHDMNRGDKKTYKLRGSDVRVGLLAIRCEADIARAMSACFNMHKTRTACSSLQLFKIPFRHTLWSIPSSLVIFTIILPHRPFSLCQFIHIGCSLHLLLHLPSCSLI